MSAAGGVQVHCSCYADSLMDERASRIAGSTGGRTQELRPSCPLFADRTQEGDRQTALGPNVVMSGVVDSGRESGHCNIDANAPQRTLGPRTASLGVRSRLADRSRCVVGCL